MKIYYRFLTTLKRVDRFVTNYGLPMVHLPDSRHAGREPNQIMFLSGSQSTPSIPTVWKPIVNFHFKPSEATWKLDDCKPDSNEWEKMLI